MMMMMMMMMKMQHQSEMSKRGARVEMMKKHMSVDLPQTCASCCCQLQRSEWLRCNICRNVNLCVACATSQTRRHPCLDEHTFTVMFRIHELSLVDNTQHDRVLDNVMNGVVEHYCDECGQKPINVKSWVRCNDCRDYDLCLKCWAASYHVHCITVGRTHTFTNMSHRYRAKVAPTCALLSEKDQTLAMFAHVGIDMDVVRLNPLYDRAYCSPVCQKANKSSMHTCWKGNWEGASAKFVGYYCPAGWRRFSVVAKHVDFDCSVTVYHGTRPSVVAKIYENGLLSRECQHGFSAAYVSPSITYCAHPRYARIVKLRMAGDRVVYAQFVVELRVNLSALKTQRKRETLGVGSEETIDPNFPENEGIELLLCKEPDGSYVTGEDGVSMTGVMVRVLDHDPLDEAEAWWWTKWKSRGFLRKRYYICEEGLEDTEASDTN